MTKRKRDAYPGGSTVISDRDKAWFSKRSTKVPPNPAGKPPPRSRAEQKAFDEFAGKQEPPKLLRPADVDESKMTQRQKAKYRRRITNCP